MICEVNGHEVHASTGGVELGVDGPPLVLVHGAGMDGTVWQLQTRYLAYRGIRAVAVDLPGHGRSSGDPLLSIPDMASWLGQFIREAGLDNSTGTSDGSAAGAHVAGHSMGTYIGIRLAATEPAMVSSLTLLGTADAMPVHPALIEAAATDLPTAAALMAAWSHDRPAHLGLNPTPGMWMLGGSRALVENSNPGALSADFAACVDFIEARQLATTVKCPVTVVVGEGDKMTRPSAGHSLAEAFSDATVIDLPGAGHMMMTEDPRAVRAILQSVA